MITSKEWYIMKILWKEKRCTLMEIVEKVQKETKWSKSTCATMVRRMTEKGVIGYEVKGKTKYFYPKVKKEDVVVQETRDFLKRIYDGSIGMMMSALVRQDSLSDEDIKELQAILKAAEEKSKNSK